jgi:ComF family protein
MFRDLSIFPPLRRVLNAGLGRLLPCTCLLCGTPAPGVLCAACAADLPLLGEHACPRCALPLAAPAHACGACLKSAPNYAATHAALRYAFPVDRLVHMLKFGHRLASADFFVARMLAGPQPSGTLIVPVPLSRERLRERGFNQAVEIARPLARALGLPLDVACLVRTRDTLPQSRLPWRARQGNLRHAFACTRDLTGQSVIVVDDVMTSGTTLAAVARILKDHGATRIENWVAARAVKGNRP